MPITKLIDNIKLTEAKNLIIAVQHDLICYQQDYVNAVEFIQHSIESRNSQYKDPSQHINIEMDTLYDMSITELLQYYKDLSMSMC